MVGSARISVRDDDIVLLVGTMKGLFLFRSSAARRRWDVGGPFFPCEMGLPPVVAVRAAIVRTKARSRRPRRRAA